MSQTLTVELPDDIYAAVEQAAQNNAQTPAEWLLTNLRGLLPYVTSSANEPDDSLADAEVAAAFAADQAALEREWQEYLAETERLRQRPIPSPEEAAAEVRAILARMGGTPLSEEEAIELAMSEEIAEWNLELD